MKLPSHNTVVAYLALFVALGGSAYAATQLPKNSVGTKQIKPNAVTTAKIKSGAVSGEKIGANVVTGANVNESTLGRVPSAASAETATASGHSNTATNANHANTATNATNANHANTATSATNAATAAEAKALEGVPSTGFLRTNAVQFHAAALNFCGQETLVEVPGWFRITTVGNCQPEFKVKVTNLSSETWQFISEASTPSVGPSSSSDLTFGGSIVDLFAISTTNPARHALIDCAFQETTAPPRISCSTRIPPAS